ncbi:MAG: 4Fe-4S binding protein [Candidatus Cloacimonetes bacterium]|nr:4Fe-4S binding protein [Candidatus Cloacimonadota bacterium]
MARKIVKEDCINCAACEDVCPVSAISEVDEKRYIDPDTCIDCGACQQVCPVSCILSPDEQ